MGYKIKDTIEQAEKQIKLNIQEYSNFLKVIGNNYKYSLENQMSIFAIQPKAKACASFDFWEQNFNRIVSRGQKGIPIYTKKNNHKKIIYVFDVSQTVPNKTKEEKEVRLWQFSKTDFSIFEELVSVSNPGLEKETYFLEKLQTNTFSTLPNSVQLFMRKSLEIAVNTRLGLVPSPFSPEEQKGYEMAISDFSDFKNILQEISLKTKESLQEIQETTKRLKKEKELLTTGIEASYTTDKEIETLKTDSNKLGGDRNERNISEQGIYGKERNLYSNSKRGSIRRIRRYLPYGDPRRRESSRSFSSQYRTSSRSYRYKSAESLGKSENVFSGRVSTTGLSENGTLWGTSTTSTSNPRRSGRVRDNKSSQNERRMGITGRNEERGLSGVRGRTEQSSLFDAGNDSQGNHREIEYSVLCNFSENNIIQDLFEHKKVSYEEFMSTLIPLHLQLASEKIGYDKTFFTLFENDTPITKEVRFDIGSDLPLFSLTKRLNQEKTEALKRIDKKILQDAEISLKNIQIAFSDILTPQFLEELEEELQDFFLPNKEKEFEQKKEEKLEKPSPFSASEAFSGKIKETLIDEEKENINPFSKEEFSHKNFKITEEVQAEILSPSERLNYNLEAISMLKRIERGERELDLSAQKVLAKYVGWGGLAKVFDESKLGQWELPRNFLKENLTEEEYHQARESTLTAFYTPKVVIDSIYKGLEHLGFQEGTILEPSCGIGNFIGNIPSSITANVHGIELDSISGRIAQLLYPESHIQVKGFEKTNTSDNFFDIAVGNVPFGDFKLTDRAYDKHNFLIHDYFFAKTIDKVRPGGVIAFITSSGTLDKRDDTIRRYIGNRCDLLGAIRLPNSTFKGVAGTDVMSDILFLKKLDRIEERELDWYKVSKEKGLRRNEYFIKNPTMVLGDFKEVSGPFGPKLACILREGESLKKNLEAAILSLEGNYQKQDNVLKEETIPVRDIPKDSRDFSFVESNGNVYYREGSSFKEVDIKQQDRILKYIEVKDALRALIAIQTSNNNTDENLSYYQSILNKTYDEFVQKYGILNSKENLKLLKEDVNYPLASSIEELDREGNFKNKGDIFFKRTIRQQKKVEKVDNPEEALILSIVEKGNVDFSYMNQLTGLKEEWIGYT